MKKPVCDLRKFRLRKLNTPEYSHLKLLLGWGVYFIMYFITENLIPEQTCHVAWMPLDDKIPFCEIFVIPYTVWYAIILGSLWYFASYRPEGFRRLMKYIIFVQTVATIIYIVYPTRQDLRPEEFPRENFFTWVVGLLYAFDTNTNVCPSLHVAISLGLISAWTKERQIPLWFRVAMVISLLLVCLSTVFIKQHSALDGFAALPLCLLAELVGYGGWYLNKMRKKRERTSHAEPER